MFIRCVLLLFTVKLFYQKNYSNKYFLYVSMYNFVWLKNETNLFYRNLVTPQ